MIASFVLPWDSPPLRSNKRMHWRVEHNHKADIRQAGYAQGRKWADTKRAEGWMFPLGQAVQVRMIWTVPTRHRRDADSGQPTLKSYLDGIVDAGILSDDSWQQVKRAWCEIEHKPGEPMKLTVEITEAN